MVYHLYISSIQVLASKHVFPSAVWTRPTPLNAFRGLVRGNWSENTAHSGQLISAQAGAPFTNRDYLQSLRGWLITCPVKCGMKLSLFILYFENHGWYYSGGARSQDNIWHDIFAGYVSAPEGILFTTIMSWVCVYCEHYDFLDMLLTVSSHCFFLKALSQNLHQK